VSGGEGSGPRQWAEWQPAEGEAARLGERQVVRGGASVSIEADPPLPPEPADEPGRRISDEEVAAGGLLTERVIEFGETREEAVVTKPVHVREELIVRRQVETRTERISDTVRRTEVDVERIEPGPEQASAADSPDGRRAG
jgi:hypothetical protein